MSPRLPLRNVLVLAVSIFLMHTAPGQVSDVKADEEIVFFPAIGYPKGKGWEIEIAGCVAEPEKRTLTLALVREALEMKDVQLTEAENKIFSERARLFLLDHERGKEIAIQICGKVFKLNKSTADGRFTDRIRLTPEDVESAGDPLSFQALLPKHDRRVFK